MTWLTTILCIARWLWGTPAIRRQLQGRRFKLSGWNGLVRQAPLRGRLAVDRVDAQGAEFGHGCSLEK